MILRKSSDAPETPIKPVHVLSVGPFGQSVANHLKALRTDVELTTVNHDTIPLPETWPDSRASVITAWRPISILCDFLDRLSHEWQKPFIPLILDSAILRLGPIVLPRRGSCWDCWVKRCQQHAAWPLEQSALTQYYAAHPNCGPRGYLEPFAMMAAAKISEAVDALDSATAIPGSIWQMDLITRKVISSTVVGIHNCPRCGLRRPGATRSFAEMQHRLAYLWTQGVEETR